MYSNFRERKISHADFQQMLTNRYYISPSKLYSLVRLLPSGQGYYVPVEDDWITIAVVAEKSPVKLTSPKVRGGDSQPAVGKKYISLKLVDLARRAFDACGAKQTTHGDALLDMLLFESRTVEIDDDDGSTEKQYTGEGSGGAYEACAALSVGTVIAILNPEILKPLAVSDTSRL
jgi:minichromosome maintenance protein 10